MRHILIFLSFLLLSSSLFGQENGVLFLNIENGELEYLNTLEATDKKLQSDVWDKQTKEKTLVDHKTIEKMFPGIFEIRYDESGNRQGGGFRNFGKSRIHWSKAYKSSQIKTLEKFYND